MHKRIVFLSVFIVCGFSAAAGEGFLRVSGTDIIDGQGNKFILRGMGLGGWMVPEGYMFQTEAFANAAWEINKKIYDMVGQQNTDLFWSTFRKNFVQRKDIERLSQLGFNSVRLPMHWALYMNNDGSWNDQGFIMTDSLLRWCGDNKIYLILDLHAAPGGQSANNISDYNPIYPSLWESEANKLKTVSLWKKLAERYKHEPWIGGYDLINETAWDLPPANKPLRDLYVMITDSIRSVDTTHILFIEGNWYATDFGGLTPAWDAKMAWSFHKYWNANDNGAINYLLALRNSTNRPLWLGESGENSNTWFTDCITLMEANNIGWCWWTIKKFSAINSPFSVPITPAYENLLRYWRGQGVKPSAADAMKGLMEMAEGLKLEQCRYNEGMIDAMMRQPYDNTTRPFTQHQIPGKIFAVDYDFGKNGIAYKDLDYHNISNGAPWNNGWVYRNDGVDIEKCTDVITNGFNVGWTGTGEFLTYTVQVQQAGTYAVTLRTAVNAAGGYIGMSWDGKDQVLVPLSQTGGWQNWGNQSLGQVDLTAGTHTVKLNLFFGGFNLNYLDVAIVEPTAVTGETTAPNEFVLHQNYPNPFNPSTTIRYSVPSSGFVSLNIYDLLGKEVSRVVHEHQRAGSYSVVVDASDISSGVYTYRLTMGGQSLHKKMIVIQ